MRASKVSCFPGVLLDMLCVDVPTQRPNRYIRGLVAAQKKMKLIH
jgi:hypothetical protein